jgi:hypothetical protein
LATQPHEIEKYMVVSYVALSPEGIKELAMFKDPVDQPEFGSSPDQLSKI